MDARNRHTTDHDRYSVVVIDIIYLKRYFVSKGGEKVFVDKAMAEGFWYIAFLVCHLEGKKWKKNKQKKQTTHTVPPLSFLLWECYSIPFFCCFSLQTIFLIVLILYN